MEPVYLELDCKQCGGVMKPAKIRVGSQALAICLALLFVVIGIALTATMIGAIVGIPMIIFGLFINARQKKVWRCMSCRTVVERG